jgi:hypothetical protein
MKTDEKRSAKKTRFRPGSTGVCEAQLWTFTGPESRAAIELGRILQGFGEACCPAFLRPALGGAGTAPIPSKRPSAGAA